METWDAIIIGGGPAGSTCARALTNAGLRVLLLDKATFPRDKPCAGWITPPVVDLLHLDLDAYRRAGHVCQPISAFRTSRLGRPPVDTDFAGPVSYGICRREFDHYLLARCGATVRMATSFASLRRTGSAASANDGSSADASVAATSLAAASLADASSAAASIADASSVDAWIVNDTLRTPLVIGAGGHFCPVAKLMPSIAAARAAASAGASGLAPGSARADARARLAPHGSAAFEEAIVAAQEIEVRMTPAQAAICAVSGDRPELFLCEDFKGYGWCFRKEDVLNIGLGRLDRHGLAAHVRAFADSLVAQGRIPRDLAWRWKGHAYLVRAASPRLLVADGLLLIGDAAGLAYDRSGEGIRPAIESALLAAQTIVDARGRYDRASLDPYRIAIEHRFGAGIIGSGNRGARHVRDTSDLRDAPDIRQVPEVRDVREVRDADDVDHIRTRGAADTSARVTPAASASESRPATGLTERLGLAAATMVMSSRWLTRHLLLRRWFLRTSDPPLVVHLDIRERSL